MAAIQTPITFVYHVGHDLIVNGVSIFYDINALIHHEKSKDYKQAGNDLGDALEKMLVGVEKNGLFKQLEARAAQLEKDADRRAKDDRVKEIIEIVSGFGNGFGIPIQPKCVSDSETFVDDMKIVVKDFEKETFAGTVAAMQKIAGSFVVAEDAAQECQVDRDSIQKIKDALAEFDSPMSLVFHFGKDLVRSRDYGKTNKKISFVFFKEKRIFCVLSKTLVLISY